MRLLSEFKQNALDLLFPIECAGCRDEGLFLCGRCIEKLPMIPPSCIVCKKLKPGNTTSAVPTAVGTKTNVAEVDIPGKPPRPLVTAGRTCRACREKSDIFAFFSPFLYDNELVRDLIHRLKYQRVRPIHTELAGLLVRSLNYFLVCLPPEAIIIPIPLYPSRERVRGFNQSRLIAQALCTTLGVAHRPDILRKIKKTAPQMELSAEKRRTNIIGTFAVADAAVVKDKTITLFDDVKTTGATLQEAARVLKDAGAKKIWAITVAH